jgi:Tol biopolymer transport system component
VGSVAVALLLGVLLARRPRERPAERAAAPPRLLPATSFPGAELDPALSPSGRLLAFCWDGPAGDNFDLYVVSVGGDRALRLTEHAAEDRNPVWAPDGERLAFVRELADGAEILIVPVLGGRETRLVSTGMRDLPDLAWSPDGRWLYFADRVASRGPTAVFRVELASGRRQQVTTPPADVSGDRDLALSPDGRQLAFARALVPVVEDLWTAPVDGGPANRLTHDLASINGIEWSADGRRLLVSSSRSGESRLWWLSAGVGRARLAGELGEGALDPTLVGSRLVFERTGSDSNVWRLDLVSGGTAPRPAPVPQRWLGSTRIDHAPAIAPDGARVAFVTDRAGPNEVWIHEPSKGSSRRLYTGTGPLLGAPAWSPDGALLVVAQVDGQHSELVAITHDGRSRRLYRAPGLLLHPQVSRDGRRVYFGSNQGGVWRIWKLALDGGAPLRVTRQGGDRAQESLDGTALFVGRRDAPGLYRVVRGGALELVPGTGEMSAGADWQVGRAHVYVRPLASSPTEARPLLRIPLTGGGAEPLSSPLDGMRLPFLGIAVAPDESYVLFGRADEEESDLVLALEVSAPRD